MKLKNRYTVVDLFAGAGGFGVGFDLTNAFKVTCSLEKDKWAANTLRYNAKESHNIIVADIRDVTTRSSITQVCKITPDVIIGGPPCQGFSIQGPAHKKDPNDPRNSLFNNFAYWVEIFEPKVFVMENVKGILNRKNAENVKVIEIIIKTFQNLGYRIDIWLLNAAEHGVPQLRERVFIVGNRFNKNISEPTISHTIQKTNGVDSLKPAITVGEALSDLPTIKSSEGEEEQDYKTEPQNAYQKWVRGKQKKVINHVAMKHTSRVIERYKQIQKGVSLSMIGKEFKVRKRNGNGKLSKIEFNSNYRHLKAEQISYTIPASFYSSFVHPNIPRNITAREAARLQSFPDWYIFKGKRTVLSSKLLQKQGRHEDNYLSQYNQIGNAVPPLLARSIANRIQAFLEKTE